MRYSRPQPRIDHRYIFGRFIRESKIVCINQDNNNIGIIETHEALRMAHAANLELVLVSQGKNGNPSTCKILDFGKYKFEQEKRDRTAKKKQRENAVQIKEVRLRPSTGEHDLEVKARQLKEFLDEGNRLKVTVQFRGREMAHRDVGVETMKKFAQLISAQYEGDPLITGRNMTVVLHKGDQRAEARAG
ncbi:translation initiation factor IF-3 [Candidatus Pacearchaeota archaeon]|nr:translation initiation factor IF-3 [Candidatus Pacearchaeota archaeon]